MQLSVFRFRLTFLDNTFPNFDRTLSLLANCSRGEDRTICVVISLGSVLASHKLRSLPNDPKKKKKKKATATDMLMNKSCTALGHHLSVATFCRVVRGVACWNHVLAVAMGANRLVYAEVFTKTSEVHELQAGFQ